jgi:choline dehydrogenase-like flavoprotein
MAEGDIADVLVVGSGPAGAMAAQTAAGAGASVTMADVGFDDPERRARVPAQDFLDVRRGEAGQHRWMIGDDAEGVAWGAVAKGEHITPPRRHILRDVDRLAPVVSETFSPFESLGYGGLGIAWGLGCWQYSPAELAAAGLDAAAMRAAYREVNARIGINAARDDLAEHVLDPGDAYLPPTRMDRNHERLLRRYGARRGALRRDGFALGRAPLALLTEDRGERGRHAYRDLDYYADLDHSAWRPWMTVDALRRDGRVRYEGGLLATRFAERDGVVELTCRGVGGERDGGEVVLRARRLVLAASALGSARIVLRSVAPEGTRLPLLCNPYSYIPCLQPSLVGQGPEPGKLGFSQLTLLHDEHGDGADVAIASLYSYQSLMLFRIVRQAPLDLADAGEILRYLMTGFMIMGLHQPDAPGPDKWVALEGDAASPTGDRLRASWAVDEATAAAQRRRRRRFVRAMRRLGAFAIREIDPGPGASIHYAGTLPFSGAPAPGRLSPAGRVHGTERVYVADSAGFRTLPAKGLTWSIMANAHLTATNALNGA